MNKVGYNERLFSGGVRKWLHEARFHWLTHQCLEFGLAHQTVLELGCFDARSISYLPILPSKYYGFDANWEGGLDSAKYIWRDKNKYVFKVATQPEDLDIGEKVDLCLCLETIEHIPPELVKGYLKRLFESVKKDGALRVTVPNEKGIVFLAKYLAKKLFLGGSDPYDLFEVMNAALGRMSRVRRHEHKGFDWEQLREQLSEFFVITQAQGVQFSWLPVWANPQVGFVLKP